MLISAVRNCNIKKKKNGRQYVDMFVEVSCSRSIQMKPAKIHNFIGLLKRLRFERIEIHDFI